MRPPVRVYSMHMCMGCACVSGEETLGVFSSRRTDGRAEGVNVGETVGNSDGSSVGLGDCLSGEPVGRTYLSE